VSTESDLKESFLVEATTTPSVVFDELLDYMASGSFKKGGVWSRWKSTGYKIVEEMMDRFGEVFVKSGSSWKVDVEALKKHRSSIVKEKEEIMIAAGAVEVEVKTKATSSDVIADDKQAKYMEENRPRLSFEKQLEDLSRLNKMLLAGASNALIIAGRGGIGKTYPTEKLRPSSGLKDGDGYFLNTGGISTAGLYRLLFKHQDDILVFDDSDDVWKDQSSRNLLKSATDTKHIRKISWSKAGKNVVDPTDDEYEGYTPEDFIDNGLLPKYIHFSGKIIFISNLKPDKLDPDGAIRTRAFLIDIDPTDEEVYDFMEKICGDVKLSDGLTLDLEKRKYVVGVLRDGVSKQTANLRKLVRGLQMYAGALKEGVVIQPKELERMISMYA
jgi:ribosomal 50S subunit-recycling heat shock protein